jgi:hypothetical protein
MFDHHRRYGVGRVVYVSSLEGNMTKKKAKKPVKKSNAVSETRYLMHDTSVLTIDEAADSFTNSGEYDLDELTDMLDSELVAGSNGSPETGYIYKVTVTLERVKKYESIPASVTFTDQ